MSGNSMNIFVQIFLVAFVFEIAVGADEEKVDGHMTDIRLSNAVRKFDDMN
jgi:hypothetical protein